jgi:hypothetical protein
MVKACSSGTNRKAAYENKCSDEDQVPERECGFDPLYRYQITMIEYSNCPRCLNTWNKSNYVLYCSSQCGMVYYLNTSTILYENIIRYRDVLFWFLEEKKCSYRLYDDVDELVLPWLSFDIKADKLKKYLLFT